MVTGASACAGLLWCGHTGTGMGMCARAGVSHPMQHGYSLLTTYYQWQWVVRYVAH
jgi:hypothetical protein